MRTVNASTTTTTLTYWVVGFTSCIGINIAVTLVLVVLFGYPGGIVFIVGFYQLVYVIPIGFAFRRFLDRSVSAGFIAAAGLMLLRSSGMLALVYLGLLSA